jgi:hypothetical protein
VPFEGAKIFLSDAPIMIYTSRVHVISIAVLSRPPVSMSLRLSWLKHSAHLVKRWNQVVRIFAIDFGNVGARPSMKISMSIYSPYSVRHQTAHTEREHNSVVVINNNNPQIISRRTHIHVPHIRRSNARNFNLPLKRAQ